MPPRKPQSTSLSGESAKLTDNGHHAMLNAEVEKKTINHAYAARPDRHHPYASPNTMRASKAGTTRSSTSSEPGRVRSSADHIHSTGMPTRFKAYDENEDGKVVTSQRQAPGEKKTKAKGKPSLSSNLLSAKPPAIAPIIIRGQDISTLLPPPTTTIDHPPAWWFENIPDTHPLPAFYLWCAASQLNLAESSCGAEEYRAYCTKQRISFAYPAPLVQLMNWAADMAASGKPSLCVEDCLRELQTRHIEYGLDGAVFDSPRLKTLLRGIERVQDGPVWY